MNGGPSARPARAWLAVAAWVAFIYLTIPLARALQGWVDAHLGRAFFLYAVAACLVAGVGAALGYLVRSGVPRRPAAMAWIAGVALAFAAGTWHLRANPEEAMHFVQYGVLSLLLFRALRTRHDDTGLYVVASLAGALCGVVDELIQWLTPRRFFDFRDMLINVCAVLLVQLALARGLQPAGVRPPLRSATLRVAFRLAIALGAVFLVLFAATPARVQRITDALGVPALDEPLVEYGHRIRGPGEVEWVSRLDPESLRAEDKARAAELGPRLAQFAGEKQYVQFLLDHPSTRDPFAHELRVHQFRRDRYGKLARAQRAESRRRAELMTIALREQEILEAYFGHTLRAAGLDWSPETRARARAAALPGPYQSPVSRHLLVRWKGWHLQAFTALAMIAFGLGVRYVAARENRAP